MSKILSRRKRNAIDYTVRVFAWYFIQSQLFIDTSVVKGRDVFFKNHWSTKISRWHINSPPRVDWAPAGLLVNWPSVLTQITELRVFMDFWPEWWAWAVWYTIILDLQGFTIFKPRALARMPGMNDHFNLFLFFFKFVLCWLDWYVCEFLMQGDGHFRPIWPFAISPISCLYCIVLIIDVHCINCFLNVWYWNKAWTELNWTDTTATVTLFKDFQNL